MPRSVPSSSSRPRWHPHWAGNPRPSPGPQESEMTEYTDHHVPEGLRTRGTIVIVPGRGETRRTYTRLGRRLAADAYRVRVIETPDIDADDPTGSLNRFG